MLSALVIALSTSITLAADTIPKAVLHTFTQLYPDIEAPFWEHRHDGVVAIFNDEEGMKKAFFREDGAWMETRIRIARSELPTGVQRFIREHYHEAEISFYGKVYTANGTWYRVESELPGKVVLKNLDDQGMLMDEQVISFSTAALPASE